VNIDILPNLSNHPSVIKLLYGSEDYPDLKTSALDIFARGSSPGFDCVWKVDKNTGVFTGMTGKGVIIGIIDSGIEWRHLNFMTTRKLGFSEQTRILRIWDPGLKKEGSEKEPDVSLLTGGPTYGVEYTKEMIDADIAFISGVSNEPPKVRIRHKDRTGHGTHVAGIAAGNGRQPRKKSGKNFIYTGIAPEASLVIVKHWLFDNTPPVNDLKLFKDAITYILKIADAQPDPKPPVVINFSSYSSEFGAHDGLGAEQEFLESQFDREPGSIGRIFVSSAGNAAGKRLHAKITIPSGGSVEIPFELYDERTLKRYTRPLELFFWYSNNVAGLLVFIKTPDSNYYIPNGGVTLGHNRGGFFDGRKEWVVQHSSKEAERCDPITGISTKVKRNRIRIEVDPHAGLHRIGTYWIKITAPPDSVVHVWCRQRRSWGYGFKLDDSITTNVPIEVTDNNTITQPKDTKSTIVVAAYDHHMKDGDNDGADDVNRRLVCYSSRGPLVDYSGLGVIADKPDISAPGWDIVTANSYQTSNKDTYGKSRCCRKDYVTKRGTSLAAPHVTGVVALMLQKKKNQTVTDIKRELNNTLRGNPNIFRHLKACDTTVTGVLPIATSSEAGSGKVDATVCNMITP
jgi:subtilisin family serine protease